MTHGAAPDAAEPQRIAKFLAHAGVASRRDAELLIAEGRVSVNGTVIDSPATKVGADDSIHVDGRPIRAATTPRLWRYYKPAGLMTTHKDPQGRPTVFDHLPAPLPRVVSVGRLDLNTEGLLLLTTDGALARHLELPGNGYMRQYRVRALGQTDATALEALQAGVTIEGVHYGSVAARILKAQGANIWLHVAISEGKNREVRRVLQHLGLQVNRLQRVAYGPFGLGRLKPGEVREVSLDAMGVLGIKST